MNCLNRLLRSMIENKEKRLKEDSRRQLSGYY